MRSWLSIAAMLLAAAVVLGAFGAHALKGSLDSAALEIYKTANFYHFVHAVGLLAVVLIPSELLAKDFRRMVQLFLLAGVLVFSGSLYALALSGLRVLGMITPIGGLLLIAAWSLLAYGAWRAAKTN